MTFIGGGRACIGFKFAELEISTFLPVLDAYISVRLTLVLFDDRGHAMRSAQQVQVQHAQGQEYLMEDDAGCHSQRRRRESTEAAFGRNSSVASGSGCLSVFRPVFKSCIKNVAYRSISLDSM